MADDVGKGWDLYRCHKEVWAAPITSIGESTGHGTIRVLVVTLPNGAQFPFIPTVQEMAAKAKVGDYAVIYRDGYQSISPKAEFDDGYSLLVSGDAVGN